MPVQIPPPLRPPETPLRPAEPAGPRRGCWFYGCLSAGVLALVVLATAGVTSWWVKKSLNPAAMERVVLTERESAEFEAKLERVRLAAEESPGEPTPPARDGEVVLPTTPEPEELDEDFVRRPLVLSERELNALIGRNTDLAERVQLRLRPNRVQLKANFPVPEDAPFFGGRTIRVNILNRVEMVDGRLRIMLENVSMGGIPLPSAWIGDIKGRDLAFDLFSDPGMARAFQDGIEDCKVEEGQITLMLAE